MTISELGERAVAWLEARGARRPVTATLVEGGHSNLTYVVQDGTGRRFVLRRPPAGELAPTAHDVIREQRIMVALADSAVPVPTVVGACEDAGVLGVPFYVMDFVDGVVLRDTASAERALAPEARSAAAWSLIDGLVALHSIEPADVGLADLGRGVGYVERQLKRWHGQLEARGFGPGHPLVEVHDALRSEVPEQRAARLVHGDYKLENCIFDDAGNLQAVLDWELCTIGDPLADLGLLLVYWSNDDPPERHPLGEVAALAPGFPDRGAVIDRYVAGVGSVDAAVVDFYLAFASWRLACITEGVWERYSSGAMGDRGDPSVFRRQADALAAAARSAVARRS